MTPSGQGATPLACPNCGAPARVQPGQSLVTCPYCQRSFELQLPVAPPPPPPQVIQPILVIEEPGLAPPPRTVARRRAGCSLFGLLPLVGLGIAGYFVYNALIASGTLPAALPNLVHPWDGTSPLECGANEHIESHDVHARFPSGSAIIAGGNCQVTCTRCTLEAPAAIAAGGNAQIVLVDSRVEGTPEAVVAGGNAVVKVVGESSVTGTVSKGGNAQVIVPPHAPPAPHASSPAARQPAR